MWTNVQLDSCLGLSGHSSWRWWDISGISAI